MRKLTLAFLAAVLGGCAQLPEFDVAMNNSGGSATAASWLLPLLSQSKSTELLMCDVHSPRQVCSEDQRGLEAIGIGGFLLPLRVSLPTININASRAQPVVVINGIDAACTAGGVNKSAKQTVIEISNVFCNWLVIGNVIANAKLTIDWEDPASFTFGGRYVIKFVGTGNGSGSGIYSAKVQS